MQLPSGKSKSISALTDQIYKLFDSSKVSITVSYTVPYYCSNHP